MGVQISEIIPRKEIEIKDLNGKVVAIDAFNTLYQFLTTIRQPDGTPLMDKKGRITSHLSGLFYRNINLLLQDCNLFRQELLDILIGLYRFVVYLERLGIRSSRV